MKWLTKLFGWGPPPSTAGKLIFTVNDNNNVSVSCEWPNVTDTELIRFSERFANMIVLLLNGKLNNIIDGGIRLAGCQKPDIANMILFYFHQWKPTDPNAPIVCPSEALPTQPAE